MADVQIDDGYTKVANELLEAIMKINLSSYEFRVIMAIMRKTYGYCKKQDYISLSQLEEITDIKANNVCRTLKKLKAKNMILSNGHLTGIQKDYDRWVIHTDTIHLDNIHTDTIHTDNKTIYIDNKTIQIDNKKLSKQIDTKEKKETYTKEIVYIVEYLNKKALTNYRNNNAKTKELIRARFNDGFLIEDFKKVIDNKVADWRNTEWEKFIRPVTLFGTKFESYLNEKPKKEIGGKKIEKL